MTSCSPPPPPPLTPPLPPSSSDPRLELRLENRTRNIFVTQVADRGNEENVNHIPVVTESPGSVLEAGVNTLQKTLVLKKQVQLDEVNKLLALRREEFTSGTTRLTQRRADLEVKQQQTKDKVRRFETFVSENEARRCQALEKYKVSQEQNVLKQKEIEELEKELQRLTARKQLLKARMSKYKIYEDYLMKTLAHLPSNELHDGSESLVAHVLQHHQNLSVTRRALLQRVGRLEDEVERSQRRLQTTEEERSLKKLMSSEERNELQRELENLREKNKEAEDRLLVEKGHARDKVQEVGTLLRAITNLGEQCHLPAYGPVENMNVLTIMDMVKEYIQDTADTERRARRLMASGSAAGTDRRHRGSVESTGSRTQIQSPSKVSKNSQTSGSTRGTTSEARRAVTSRRHVLKPTDDETDN